MDSISMCSNTLYMSNMDEGSSLGGGQPQPWCNDIILTPHVTQNPKTNQEVWVWLCKAATVCPWTAYQCAQTLYIHLIWMREAVWGGCQSQSGCTDNILTPQMTQSPQIWAKCVGITVWGCYRMPMDSISMYSSTLYLSKMDNGSSLRWLSASTMTKWHHFDSTSYHIPKNLSQVGWV